MKRLWINYHVFLCCLTAVLLTLPRAAAAVESNRMAEVSFESARTYPDPFNEVTLDAVFTTPDGDTLRVPAFWAGGGTWRVRYASPVTGKHRFRTECSDAANASLHGVTGEVVVTRYIGSNALFRHGPVRVADDRLHFAYADGTPFFWLGDTWWMGLVKRLQWPDDFHQLTTDRRDKGFTVVQIVAGLYPDMAAFDERGLGDAGQPWEKLYARIRPEYFDAADRRIQHLVEQGLSPCILGCWGYHLPWLGTDKMKSGHTYGVNGVWQVNLPDKRFGKSPVGNDWGGTPWQEAMNLPGSTQLAHAKRFLLTLPWHQLAPTTNTITGAISAAATQTDDAHWHSAPWGGRHRWISPNCAVRPRGAGSIRRAVN